MDMGMMEDMDMEQGGGFKLWYVLLPLALVIAAVVVIVVIRRKNKKKKAQAEELAALDEELDDLEDVSLEDDADETADGDGEAVETAEDREEKE